MLATGHRAIAARCTRMTTSQASPARACWSAARVEVDFWREWLNESMEGECAAGEKLNKWTRCLRGGWFPIDKSHGHDLETAELQKGKYFVRDNIEDISQYSGPLNTRFAPSLPRHRLHGERRSPLWSQENGQDRRVWRESAVRRGGQGRKAQRLRGPIGVLASLAA